MILNGTSLIAGAAVETSGTTFTAFNPATGAILEPLFYEASTEVADRALAAAAAAFDDFQRRSANERADFLDTIASEIEALGDVLIERAVAESGLPGARISGERGRTCGQLRLFAEVVREGSWVDARIDTALPERQPVPRPDIRRMLKPIGPVVVFGASNFPLAFSTAGGDTASAFAAGCPVVVKAHPAHPGTGELVGRAIASAAEICALPAGVFSLVHGGPSIAVALVRHPATAAVGFTGSHRAGRALFDAASGRPNPIPVFGEMSSVNPVFLLPGALEERAAEIAENLVGSFTLGTGQFCTKPGLVFAIRDRNSDGFVAALVAAVGQVASGTMLSVDILDAFERSRMTVTAVEGVSIAAEAAAPAAGKGVNAGASVATTDAKHFLAHPELATEVFGPFAIVVLADSEEEMLACARSIEGQLTATFHGTQSDIAAAGALMAAAERFAGRLIVNGFPTGVEVSPAMNHGGPYPATTDARFTSVGTAAVLRFARPVCYQGFPEEMLPPELRDANPRGIMRTIDGTLTRDAV
ncbi:MAG: aldehyde dehydrogenase (NADP(+)) [Gammaproteobacteria bacterium]|jgi:NADP-dependent aldehyde dehydrogenase